MKYAALLVAGLALAGCDITLGANGPVITQRDSILSQVVPLGTRTPTEISVANTSQTVVSADQAAPSDRPTPRAGTGVPILISGRPANLALPIGVTRNHVEQFKTAVADAGCTISTSAQRAAIQSQTGFTDERLDRIIGYVWRAGDLDRRSGFYQLTSGRCADA